MTVDPTLFPRAHGVAVSRPSSSADGDESRLHRPLSALLNLLLSGLLIICSSSLIACDEEPKATPMPDMGRKLFGEDDMGPTQGGAESTGGSEAGDLESYLSYTRLVGTPEGTRGDLVVFNIDRNEEILLNEGVSLEEMDCVSRGCLLHPDLTWVAWFQRGVGMNALWIAPIDRQSRTVKVDDRREVSSNSFRFSFTKNSIIYSEMKDPSSSNGVAVMVVPLEGGDAQEVALIDPNGGFSTTLLDDVLILIKTTLSTLNISFLNLENGSNFDLFTFGESGGQGSEFSATTNPVKLAPDNSYLVAVTNNEFMWRVHTLEVTDVAVEPSSRDLFPVRNVPEACSGNYPFTQVTNEPIFSVDSQSFYLLFNGGCNQDQGLTNRPDYDIYKFSKDLTQEPINLTQIPKISNWSNHDIRSFAISPDERRLAFVATRPNKNGTFSIWILNLGEGDDESSFDCTRSEGQIDPTGVRRCEYIFNEGSETTEYRGLTYHQTSTL